MALPELFCKRIQDQFPEDGSALLDALKEPFITSIRINPFKKFTNELDQKVPWCEHGFYLKERPLFTADPLFHGGAYYVQEASSMVIEYIFKKCFNEDQPIKAVDLCAAPGGKSTLLMSLLNKDSYLVSNEFVALRSSILQENIIKWGIGNAFVTNNDVAHFKKLKNHFDLMLIDAPCSGEGLFRKDEDAYKEWSESNCRLCERRQEKVLQDSWDCLKPGGYMFYATCTFNELENEKLLEKMQPILAYESISISFPKEWGITTKKAGNLEGYQFYPHKTKGEGFFIAVLKKPGTSEATNIKKRTSKTENQPKMIKSILGETYEAIMFKDQLHAFSPVMMQDFSLINKSMNLKYGGVAMGEMINGKLIPAHDLALSVHLNLNDFERIVLNRNEAIQYLSRKEFVIDYPSTGWKLIYFENRPLGFIKHLGQRWNNYYPQHWRIRMDIKTDFNTQD